MSSLTMSIMGIERYITERGEDSLFKDITLPEDFNKELLVDTILNDTAGFETLYSNPTYLRFLIQNWFKTHYYTFNKWIEALAVEYNPLDNYDRYEEYTDSEGINSIGHDTSSTTSNTTDTLAGTSTEKTVPYEDGTLTDRGQTVNSSSDTVVTTNGSTSDTTSGTERTLTHTAHIRGNIGVTSSMELLRNQLEVVRFNLIQQISDLFISDFCLMIY